MTFFNYLVEQFSIHSHSLPGAFKYIRPHELNQHFTSIHALYMTSLNLKDLGWAYYPIPDKGNTYKCIADGFFYNRITNDYITMQYKYRKDSSLNDLHLRELMLNYHHSSHFIEIGHKNHYLYKEQLNVFNRHNTMHDFIIRDYSHRYGLIGHTEKKNGR